MWMHLNYHAIIIHIYLCQISSIWLKLSLMDFFLPAVKLKGQK